jgi:hypothetical protein
LAEFDGLGRGPHRGDLRNLRARDSLTETTLRTGTLAVAAGLWKAIAFREF